MLIPTACPDSPGKSRRAGKTFLRILFFLLVLTQIGFAQAPIISVSPDSLSENLLSGKSSNQTLTIFNNGGSDLNFKINIKENLEASFILLDRPINDNHYINDLDQTSKSTSLNLSNDQRYSSNYISLKEPLNNFNNESTNPNKYLLGGMKILLITSASVPPDEIRNALLSFSDIQTVDVFDASIATPNLNQLLPYHSVIIMNDSPCSDPVSMGNALADYVDAGRALIMTIATFASGWEVQGRLFNENYFPFNVGYGPVGSASLGTFNQNHPIMQGVTNAYSDLLVEVTLADSAELVASWNNGLPFVGTKGRNVVAVNAFVTTPGGWTGDIPLILHNAAFWAGGCGWLSAEPDTGTIPAGSSMNITMDFEAASLIEGEYNANIIISSDDLVTPELTIPAKLNVIDAPAISVETDPIDFGEVFLGVTDTFYLEVKNIGSQDLLIFDATIQPDVYTVHPTFAGIDPEENEIFAITFSPQVVGNYPGTLTFNSNDPIYGSYIINISGQGVEPPVIVVSPDSLVVSVLPGSTTTKTLTISNQGESNLFFNIKSYLYLNMMGGNSSTNYALQFDGVDDVVTGPATQFPIGNSSRTLELWFKRISQPFEEGHLFGYGGWGWENADRNFGISLHQSDWFFSQWGIAVLGSTIIQSNQWYHSAVVNVGNNVVLYLNGEVDGTGNLNINTLSNTSFYMGKAPPEYDENRKLNGFIDEVRIWNVALTQEDIQGRMHQQLAGTEPGLVGYWQFNEGTGITAYDKTGNSQNGLLQGGVTWINSSAPIGPSWLTSSLDSGVCLPNSSMDIEFLFDATELDTGDYYGSIAIKSSDPFTPSVVVPIHMIVSTSVNVEEEQNIPRVFSLYQNYPNPFNPSTKIKYSISELSKVILKVFNVLGEEVITLINEEEIAGNYSLEFNASSLPSGVYFYQLKAGEYTSVKKMILLK